MPWYCLVPRFFSFVRTGMSLNTIYIVSSALALIGWIVLLVSSLTAGKISDTVVRLVPALLSMIYLVLLITLLPFEGGSLKSLTDITSLFNRPECALVGWVHYLAFDLFVGSWQVQTARRQQIPKMALIPTLLLTMLVGPVGLLFFLLAHHVYKGRAVIVPQQ